MQRSACATDVFRERSHFTGKERDTESGNDYFKYRYLASSMGRWLSPDPSGLTHADLGNPQSLNLYNYVGNNPLTRTDLDGLCWKGFQWACDLGQAIRNAFSGDGFHTDKHLDAHPNQKKRENSYLKETGAANSGHQPGLIKRIVCAQYAGLLGTASMTNKTVGEGAGGSAGAGIYSQGFAISLGAQVVADPQGNLGLASTFGAATPFSAVVQGDGAYGGVQVSGSNAQNVSQLGGPAVDASASYGEGLGGGVDASAGLATNSQGQLTGQHTGTYTVTGTGPFAVGGFGGAGMLTQTGVVSMKQRCPLRYVSF
jgi:RHS repeat-associated protein